MTPSLRIFHVEDDKLFQDMLGLQMKNLGYTVCGHADNVKDAIDGIQKTTPDLVLIDIELYGKFDGLAIGDFLINKTDIPFIYTSGHDEKQILVRARETIPDGFLVKPFDDKDLRVAIEMAMRT